MTLIRSLGPLVFEQGGRAVPLHELRVARSDSGVALTDDSGLYIDLVEHLLGALGGTAVRRGLRVRVEGPELPLLDGGARRYVDALRRMGLVSPSCPAIYTPPLRVGCPAELRSGDALYRFQPGPSVDLAVEIRFDNPGLRLLRAHWFGGVPEFVDAIAPARTFGFLRDAGRLFASGRASGFRGGLADLASSVLVYDDAGVASMSPLPSTPDEPARHKLLDLVGDLYLYGGPPCGAITALCPTHTATHDIVRRALAQGVLTHAAGEP